MERNGPNFADVPEMVELLKSFTIVDEKDSDAFTEFYVYRYLS